MLLWIREYIYDKNFLCDDEDIFQLIQIDLWKYNSFQNFKIAEDDTLFVNTFEKYLRKVIVKRAVVSYFRKNDRKFLQECVRCYGISSNEITVASNEAVGQVAKSIACEASEIFNLQENEKGVKELLELACESASEKGNAKRDIKMFILNKVSGYSVSELSVKFGVSSNTVSTAIWRVGNKMKDILKENF